MKAIQTRYSGATNTRGSRIIATDGDGHRVPVLFDDSSGGTQGAHRRAAVALRNKMKWSSCDRLAGGALKKGYAFVFVPSDCKCSRPLEGARKRRRK